MAQNLDALLTEIRDCTLCVERFAATKTAHSPRPVAWVSDQAPILIIGQAPGARVHESARPFTDPSGDRLREWLGVGQAEFYDQSQFSILPMAFCFPGYSAKGADLPPPPICAKTWHETLDPYLQKAKLTLLIGGYAQKYYLKTTNVTQTVTAWRDHWPRALPLPHPSWRNTAWLKKNPWFDAELVPILRARVSELLKDDSQ